MSAQDSSRKTLEMECFHTRFSAWTPFSNKSLNRELFQERVALISHWFDLWTNKQRQEFLFTIFLRCTKSQLRIVQEWFSERMQMAKVDFSTVLPRFISLYIFSFLNPKDLCAAAQVSWAWKFLTEQDCLWMPKCIRFGWFLPYTPTDNEYGAWKHHYIACVSNLDWPIPREATAMYGTLNEPKREDEELQERQREKCLRKIIWEKIALRKSEQHLKTLSYPTIVETNGFTHKFPQRRIVRSFWNSMWVAFSKEKILSVLSDWLGRPWERDPFGIYFSESKLQMWSSLADFLEDTLKSVRKQLSPLFKELRKNISAKIIGQFMFDHMSVANILNNQEIAQALADGLMELSKDNSDKPLEFLSNFLLKKSSKESKDFGEDVILTKCDPKATFDLFMKERNVRPDNPQDAESSRSKNDLNFETLVKLERKLQMDSAGKRTGVVRELLRSERKYVQMLETVKEVYAAPLQAALSSNRAILSAANIRIIFSDVLRILGLNRQFLDHLRDRLQEWGPAHGVGEIFLKFGSQLNTYTNFFNNYPVVLKTMEKCRETIPAFRAFLKRHDKTVATKMLSLPELLLYPSRRFEEYINLLHALRLHTPAEHVDRGDLTAAIDQVKNYKRYIDQMKQNIGMRDQLSDIQRIVRGCPTLSEENRYLIRVQDVAQLHCCDEAVSFPLRTYEHTRDLSLFLFNDALLVSSRGTSHTPFERTSKSTYQFIASVALHRLLVEDIPDSKYIRNAFIVQGPKREWICATEAGDDKFLWLSALQRAIKSSLDK
uniref:epithelial cell-transforming sequence 2 oncogene-like n=1 Tax=Panthera onca TaxID=9690 RepID=UPI002954603A|nr:epithelial cell-transforming sequence 2 oncogene-like [Panthera onca]